MVEHKRVGGVQEVAGEEIVSIEHIPANDWAAVGARLERFLYFDVTARSCGGRLACVRNDDGVWFDGVGKTVLEALTAALDAAEGAK